MSGQYPKEVIDAYKVRCQDALDRISMHNPHTIIVACMNSDGKVALSKVSFDPGVECLLAKSIEIAVNEYIKDFLILEPKAGRPAPPQTPPSSSDPTH